MPLEDFFRNPAQSSFTISPDGEHLAYLSPWKRRMQLHVRKAAGGSEVRITHTLQRDIRQYHWVNSNRIVYYLDEAGDENFRLWAVDKNGNNELLLTPQDHVSAMVVDVLKSRDAEILVGLNARDPRLHDVYVVDVHTGVQQLVVENPGNVTSWLADHEGQVRAAVATDGVNATLLLRQTDNEPFRRVLTTNFRERVTPLLFSFDNRNIYAASNLGRDKTAIVRMDMYGNELEVVFDHPEVDAGTLLYSRKHGRPIAATYTTWKRQHHFLDEGRRVLQARLDAHFPGYDAEAVSMSDDEQRLIVHVANEKTLGAYYLFGTPEHDPVKLGDASPWLREEHMAEMRPISFPARDGLTIHGYLTIPPGRRPENLPVVVNPHGGPWFRDTWGYNQELQFLASRGYAALQMNFRGSLGYGRAFWERGFRQWGRAMQDDVTDGVRWLLDQGIADPHRIAIYGSSYGGYAALAGLTFTPELYACGIDYVGISNLLTFMSTIPPYLQPFLEMMHEMVGDPVRDREMLQSVSPVYHVNRIRAPLLVAQGAMDPRVNKAESDQMVQALREQGIHVPYIVKDNEGHGFSNQENRFEFYRAMEEFLDRHLNPKPLATAV